MVFLQPIFLYGLFLLTIPILIHFLNFRKSKTIYFSSLRFIEEVKSTYRQRNRLTDLLLLLLRLFMLACLIIAFAQPVIRKEKTGNSAQASVVGLFIDNSQSMELAEQGESLLTRAKAKATDMVGEFPPGSKFQLLYNGNPYDMPGITDKELTLKLIDGIQQAANELTLDEVLRFFSQGNPDTDSRLSSVILISDFQESLFAKPLSGPAPDLKLFTFPIQPAATANISIDTCWLDNPVTLPDQNNQIMARINNRSEQSYEDYPVRLVINDTLRNETSVKLPAHTVTEVNLSFHPKSSGWQKGSVEISDFPVVFDNKMIFSFRIESNIPVLELDGAAENKFFRSVFGDDPYFRFEAFGVNGFPRSDFRDYNLVILNGINDIPPGVSDRIRDYLNSGGTVWFFPELSGTIEGYNAFLKSIHVPDLQNIVQYRVESRIAPGQSAWLQEVVVNVDKRLRLPYFNQSFRISATSPDRTDILNSVSGDLLLSRFRVGNGSFVLSGFPLDDKVTDFMFHPLFIPICYRIATMSKNSMALYRINGSGLPVPVVRTDPGSGNPVRLKNPATNFETTPVQHAGAGSETVLFPGELPDVGFYSALSGNDTVSWISFNSPRKESDLSYRTDSTVNSWLRTAGWNIPVYNNSLSGKDQQGPVNEIATKKIWYYFLIMALVALLAESLVMNAKK